MRDLSTQKRKSNFNVRIEDPLQNVIPSVEKSVNFNIDIATKQSKDMSIDKFLQDDSIFTSEQSGSPKPYNINSPIKPQHGAQFSFG